MQRNKNDLNNFFPSPRAENVPERKKVYLLSVVEYWV